MPTLLITLQGPLQSWGGPDGYQRRGTMPRPTKSGVIGMLAGMLGRPRDTDNTDLARMRMGVRVDKPGRILDDLQTMGRKPHGDHKPLPLQDKTYLMDARFTVGLETNDVALLDRLMDAIARPTHPPYLGRRSCPPAGPIPASIHPDALEAALEDHGHDLWVEDPAGGILEWTHPLPNRRFGATAMRRIPARGDVDFFQIVKEATR